MSSNTRRQLEAWVKPKVLSGKILDVGGLQNPIDGRAKLERLEKIVYLDLPEPHKVHPAVEGAGYIAWDLNDLISLGSNLERMDMLNSFDYAVCLEVSEYWYDPLTALKNIAAFLKIGGKLLISFHFIYPVHNPVEQDYLRYTRMGVLKLLDKAGFSIVEIVARVDEGGMINGAFVAEGMRPARDYATYRNEIGLLVEAVKK
jgi:SAM-dependent methyltransferase